MTHSSNDGFHSAPYQVAFQNGLGQNFYMATQTPGTYYSPAMSPDLTSGIYNPIMNVHSWPAPQSVSPVFSPSRPPPPLPVNPPLPNSPPPERPPMPPPITNTIQPNYATSSLYRGRGAPAARIFGSRRVFGKFKGFNRAQIQPNGQNPQPSGLHVRSPESLNEQVINPAALGGKKLGIKMEGNKEPHDPSLPVVSKKKKRRPMSERFPTSVWKREDAQRVLDLEKEYAKKRGDKSIVIRFPDPKLDYEIVKGFSAAIQSVHFQNPAGPRSCIVHLKQDAEMEKVIEEINKTPFGQGFLVAEERRKEDAEDEELRINDIDPYTLYIGNLPWNIHAKHIKQMFRNAKKVDIGYSQKMKVTRYGFVRYTTVDDAIEAYKKYVNELYETRSIIVRFRRNNSSITEGNSRKTKKDDVETTPEKGIHKDNETENEKDIEQGNDFAYSESEMEDDVEDSKSCIFGSINNLTEQWFSDDMGEDGSEEEEEAPNLTGLIKNEPEDEPTVEIREEHRELLGAECDDIRPTLQPRVDLNGPNKLNHRCFSESEEKDVKTSLSEIPTTDRNEGASNMTSGEKDWEQIRQEELNTKEEKPNIQALNPPLQLDSPPTPSDRPITTYGLVPMILPKEEKKNDSEEEEKPKTKEQNQNKDKGEDDNFDDFDDFEDCDEDQAFENAWNSMEVKAN